MVEDCYNKIIIITDENYISSERIIAVIINLQIQNLVLFNQTCLGMQKWTPKMWVKGIHKPVFVEKLYKKEIICFYFLENVCSSLNLVFRINLNELMSSTKFLTVKIPLLHLSIPIHYNHVFSFVCL